jgi:hypothetical protein
VAFTIPAGRPFHAITGQVRITSLERITFTDTIRKDAASNRFTWTPADTVYGLDFEGEGYQAIWHRGHVTSEYAFWSDPELPVHVEGSYESAWWAQVADSTGQVGWMDMGERVGNMHGADACGGPSGIPADWTGPWVVWTSPAGTFSIEVPPGWGAYPRSRWSEENPLPEGVVEEVELRTPRLGVGATITVRRADAPPPEGSTPTLSSVEALGRVYQVTAPAPAPADSAEAHALRARLVASLEPLRGTGDGG